MGGMARLWLNKNQITIKRDPDQVQKNPITWKNPFWECDEARKHILKEFDYAQEESDHGKEDPVRTKKGPFGKESDQSRKNPIRVWGNPVRRMANPIRGIIRLLQQESDYEKRIRLW